VTGCFRKSRGTTLSYRKGALAARGFLVLDADRLDDALSVGPEETVHPHDPSVADLVANGRPFGVSDALVGEEGDAVTDGLRVDEAHGLLVAGLAEEALAGPEHDSEVNKRLGSRRAISSYNVQSVRAVYNLGRVFTSGLRSDVTLVVRWRSKTTRRLGCGPPLTCRNARDSPHFRRDLASKHR
jgi:hypothetical protein